MLVTQVGPTTARRRARASTRAGCSRRLRGDRAPGRARDQQGRPAQEQGAAAAVLIERAASAFAFAAVVPISATQRDRAARRWWARSARGCRRACATTRRRAHRQARALLRRRARARSGDRAARAQEVPYAVAVVIDEFSDEGALVAHHGHNRRREGVAEGDRDRQSAASASKRSAPRRGCESSSCSERKVFSKLWVKVVARLDRATRAACASCIGRAALGRRDGVDVRGEREPRSRGKRARRRRCALGAAAGARPIVAIVGRPQRGQERAVQPPDGRAASRSSRTSPGVTRDRHYADASGARPRRTCWSTPAASIPRATTRSRPSIADQVRVALSTRPTSVVCVLDATTEADAGRPRGGADCCAQANKPVLYVANKVDNSATRASRPRSSTSSGIDDLHRSPRCTATASATSRRRSRDALPRAGRGRRRGDVGAMPARRNRRPSQRGQVVARQPPARRGPPNRRRAPRHHRRQRRRAATTRDGERAGADRHRGHPAQARRRRAGARGARASCTRSARSSAATPCVTDDRRDRGRGRSRTRASPAWR